MKQLPDQSSPDRFELLYCGNLGVGRALALDRVAKVLWKIDPKAVLSIYGQFITEEEKELVCSNKNVQYGGMVPYSEVANLMSRASMVLHCENPERVENLRFAFSTKIADCLSSGRPFLVVADEAFPFVQYLRKNQCCHIACSEGELLEELRQCMEDESYRRHFGENAVRVAHDNHSKDSINKKMLAILMQVSNRKQLSH